MSSDAASPRPVAIANRHPRLRLDRRAVSRAIHTLDAAFSRAAVPPGELSLVFLPDPALARLHAVFLDDPSATDVITFEGDSLAGTAGEICVSADMAAAAAKKHGHTFSEEMTLYLVHGWLHLAGYDDLEPRKKRVMRRAEATAMELLRDRGSLPRFTLKP